MLAVQADAFITRHQEFGAGGFRDAHGVEPGDNPDVFVVHRLLEHVLHEHLVLRQADPGDKGVRAVVARTRAEVFGIVVIAQGFELLHSPVVTLIRSGRNLMLP
ncbi:MAG: hypothetical protein EXR82_08950 [Gammaproteobacteria bacterium]|nr:hypothetical protein [Gammaproteobacteria bacterium]